jgi:hypothetical protein
MSNYKFYAKKLRDISVDLPRFRDLFDRMADIDLDDKCKDNPMWSSSPSLLRVSRDKYAVCVRFVNYYYKDGCMIWGNTIETKNVLGIFDWKGCAWELSSKSLISHDTSYDAYYVGIDDLRIVCISCSEPLFRFHGNRPLSNWTICIQTGILDKTGYITEAVLANYPGHQAQREKNWVFLECEEKLTMIYKWHPLTIGNVDPVTGAFEKTAEIATPSFFQHVRGSTNGVRIGDEIWFLSHIISHENIRYYYHLFIVLSAKTWHVLRYTPFFTFEKIHVEYTLGFTYEPDEDVFLIGYSLCDGKTKYMCVPKERVEADIIVATV